MLATRTEVGLQYLGADLNVYTATLPEPCVLTSGWVSILGVGDPDCWFLWMSSTQIQRSAMTRRDTLSSSSPRDSAERRHW